DKTMANFRELGAYTILHYVDNNSTVQLFIEDQIGQLISYSQKKNNDLFNTLYVYLQNNGHLKNTAEALYIHRSSLIYRMDRIAQLLNADLEDAEVRFNLLMAYKLYDMFKKEM
ncbi:MAG TPA: helix-turn-helix domain-containing protein, partial [Ureibacillus sp.]|nr:helix-turn-helix domain-containing protein [Ureibacillus sp.]